MDLDFGRLVPAFFRALMLSYSPFFFMLATPFFSRPIVGREFVIGSLNATRTGAVAFLSGWLVFFNRHNRVTESDEFYLIPLLGQDRKLLWAARRSLGTVYGLEAVTFFHSFYFV